MKKQEEETARTSTEVAPPPPQEVATLDPQQQEMIEKLVSMQKQCNKRSFLDRPKVTVSVAAATPRPSHQQCCRCSPRALRLCVSPPPPSRPPSPPSPAAVATESGLAEPRSASAAVRPLHRAGHHVGAGDRGLCQAASWFLGADAGGSDRLAEDFHHRGSRFPRSRDDPASVVLCVRCPSQPLSSTDHAAGDVPALQPLHRQHHLPERLQLQ